MGSFILEFLLDAGAEAVFHFLPDRWTKTKYEKHLKRLKEEAWFCELERDYRYEYIIQQNSRVKRFLNSEKNIKLITSVDDEKEKFIALIKEEHARFTAGR